MTDYTPFVEGAIPGSLVADTLRDAFINAEVQLAAIQNVDVAGTPLVGTPNLVWSSGNGSDLEASFRALVSDDIPTTLSGKTLSGGALSGTFTGAPTFNGNPVFSGNPNFTGNPTFSNLPVEFNNTTQITDYTITSTDRVIIFGSAAVANRTFTLPAVSGLDGWIFTILNQNTTYKVDVDGDGSETVDDIATYAIAPGGRITLVCDESNSNWVVKEVYNPALVRVEGHNGFGSTGTNIARYSTVNINNTYGIITYNDSATNGASFTINQDGVYNIIRSEGSSTASDILMGISLNSSNLAANITSLAAVERLIYTWTDHDGGPANAGFVTLTVTANLKAGDIIRPQNNVLTNITASADRCYFRVERVG